MKIKLLSLVAGLSLVSGCGSWPDPDPYFEVESKVIDRVEIHYFNIAREPVYRVRVYVSGDGQVEVRKGTSTMVTDDFAKDVGKDSGTMTVYRTEIDRELVRNKFQELVNAGLFLRDKGSRARTTDTVSKRKLSVNARINGRAYIESDNVFEVDPDLAELLMDMVRMFDR